MEVFDFGSFFRFFLRTFIEVLATALTAAIFVRVILSWVRIPLPHVLERWLHDVTEPVLAPIRRALPLAGGLDFSPLVALLVIQFAERILVQLVTLR